MVDFPSTVNPPGAASYSAPLLNFSQFANWAADDPYAEAKKKQEQQLNDERIKQAKQQEQVTQQQIDQSSTFKDGIPRDAQGNVDYAKAAQMLAQKGDISGAMTMLQQQPAAMSPMFGGAQSPQGQQQAQPASVAAKPLPAPAANSPQGDPGSGTITDLVTAKLPNQDVVTGQTIAKVAQVMGVDPNAVLTPGQQRRAQGLVAKYAAADGGNSSGGQGGGSPLPPSANAGSPAPQPAPPKPAMPQQPQPQQGAPQGQPAPQQQVAPQAPQAPQQQAPQQAPQGPITPQVPLPKGFNDPQQAILALRAEAARLSANPKAAGQVLELNNWAKRIEDSTAPVDVNPNTTRLDPRTGQILYQGPTAALLSGAAGRSETIESDAEVYRQTGKMPQGLARTPQGQAEAHAIRELAREKEIAAGGDPAEWSEKWQKFQSQATGRRTLENRAVGLTLAENEASSLIPRVREASARVSRTEYPSINALIEAAKKGTGDPNVIKLGIAVESLVPVYARVLKPVGQVGQGDMARAHDILDKAWSDGQIGAALDQMGVELKSARGALDKTMKDFGRDETGQNGGASSNSSSTAKWVTLPNGVRIREISP